MKDKATFQNKVKVLNKLFDSGCDTEKKLQQLDMEAILKIPNITIPDMGVIMELQKNTKSGKLFLMALAHKIGEDKCTIFAQDISQRSNKMLKLNLILNSLVSSLDHAIQGDTLIAPYHNRK